MATPNFPRITSELVDLVETMRQAQIHLDELNDKHSDAVSQHQIRRAEQACRAASAKVDLWLLSYHADVKKYIAWAGTKKTDEQPGLYLGE